MEAVFAVLNPGGRDKFRAFPNGAGSPDEAGHPPVNYHAYAACLRGVFCQAEKEIPASVRGVLVLLRKKGLDDARRAVGALKKSGRKVFISWKESGLHQVADALGDAGRYQKFGEICREADGFVSSTPELTPLYHAAGCRAGEFVPTPYPVEEASWDFARPWEERLGIFVGTREFSVPSRNHLLAVSLAVRLGHAVTLINTEGRAGEKLLGAISKDIRVITGRLPYPEYLRLMAQHRVVFQLDRSAVPGQVAGDALLCRVPCVGGDGAVDRLAFAPLGGSEQQASAVATRLLEDDDFYREELERGRAVAPGVLGFAAVGERLEKLIS